MTIDALCFAIAFQNPAHALWSAVVTPATDVAVSPAATDVVSALLIDDYGLLERRFQR